MAPYLSRLFVALGVGILIFGTVWTYEKYRGTDLSRVPVFGKIAEDSRQDSSASGTLSPAVRATPPSPALARSGMLADELLLYPTMTKGMRTPFDLWRYLGRGETSFGSPVLPMRFEQWLAFHEKQKPILMRDVKDYMDSRFDFTGEAIPGHFMAGGKPIMVGPVARLSPPVESFEALAALSPEQMKRDDLFPYKPLAHPLQSTSHMVFPEQWINAHPEHRRIDVDMDFPDDYMPEFPPPMILTTHK
jgi:hypothetical protein